MDCIPGNPNSSAGSLCKANNSKKKKGTKKSKGVMKLSTDPQSVAARERRHRISNRFKILQSMVPGGSKMDTVSMLEEAIHYVKFLQTQILLHQTMMSFGNDDESLRMFLPEQVISFQQNPSSEDNIPQQPVGQCFFQGENATFDATLKYWQA